MYRATVLPVVSYGGEKWSLILRGEHGLRVFEKRVLGTIFVQKMEEVTSDWGATT